MRVQRALMAGLALLRRHGGQLLLGMAVLGLFCLSLFQAARLERCWPGWSLRYHSPLSGAVAEAARQYAAQQPEAAPWPTFWTEAALPLQSELATLTANCLLYSGEGALVWPAVFTAGGWPGATDHAGCVISTALAWQLWGSQDVLGNTLLLDGEVYYVRGVFTDEAARCIAQTGDAGSPAGWQGVELEDAPHLARAEVESYALASGLGVPNSLLGGEGYAAAARGLCMLPVAIIGVALLCRGAGRLRRRRPAIAKWLLPCAGLGLLLCLPLLAGALPAWAVPSKWSDFSHWAGLLAQLNTRVEELLALLPAMRDVPAKKALLLLGAASLTACPLGLWLATRPPARPRLT